MSEKDTTLQFRVSSDILNTAREIFEDEGKTLSQALREYLEEVIVQGKTPIRRTLSANEQAYKSMVRKEERAIDNICGLLPVKVERDSNGRVPEDALIDAICGDKDAKDLPDEDLRSWGNYMGLPKTLSLTVLAELYDCGLFPRSLSDIEDEFRIETEVERSYGAENIRQNAELVKLRLITNALNSYYAEIEALQK